MLPATPQLTHDPPGWVDFQVAPAYGDAVDVELEGAADGGFEGSVLAHPAGHRGRVGQVTAATTRQPGPVRP